MIQVVCLVLMVGLTLGITFWAAKRGTGREGLYAAGGKITAAQNALAITGDFVSAAAILGSVALFYAHGLDAAIFFISPLVGLCLLLIYVAGPLRRLGRFTLGDVLATQLPGRSVRILTGISTVLLSEMYVVAQLVGAGTLFSTMFGISFEVAVFLVCALIIAYVVCGGMLATTWVQILKAALLIGGVFFLSALGLIKGGGSISVWTRSVRNQLPHRPFWRFEPKFFLRGLPSCSTCARNDRHAAFVG